MTERKTTSTDPLARRLADAARASRPSFDAARHERVMRALSAAAPPVDRKRRAHLWGPALAAAIIVLAAAAVALVRIDHGEEGAIAHRTAPQGLLEEAIDAVSQLDQRWVTSEEPVVRSTMGAVRQWSDLERDAEEALVWLDRFAVQLALAEDR